MKGWKAAAGVMLVAAVLVIAPLATAKETAGSQVARRGEYLVTVGGCNDCHTPWKMGPNGPAPDLSRLLSGHPQDMTMPVPPRMPPGPWVTAISGTMTAWSGPWGVSYTANLTPDPDTGLGKWTNQNFIEAMRSGRHMGRGRPILPPMPFYNYAKLSDPDLKAVFAYLGTIPAIKNRVPDPVPPETATAGAAAPAETGTGSATSGNAPSPGTAAAPAGTAPSPGTAAGTTPGTPPVGR